MHHCTLCEPKISIMWKTSDHGEKWSDIWNSRVVHEYIQGTFWGHSWPRTFNFLALLDSVSRAYSMGVCPSSVRPSVVRRPPVASIISEVIAWIPFKFYFVASPGPYAQTLFLIFF